MALSPEYVYLIREGDILRVWLPELLDCLPHPEDIPLDVLYEDEAFVVVIDG